MERTARMVAIQGIARVAMGALVALALAGCGATRYQAKVITGETGRAMVVSDHDTRLEPMGLGGIEVQVIRKSGMGARAGHEILASAISEEDGSVTLSIPNDRRPKGLVIIQTGGDQIYPSTNSVYLPRDGERLLVLVKQRAARKP